MSVELHHWNLKVIYISTRICSLHVNIAQSLWFPEM